jgi:hypothetical protein
VQTLAPEARHKNLTAPARAGAVFYVGGIMPQAQIYWARAERWRQVGETATSAKIRAAYVELAVAYERLATLEAQAGDGSSRPIAMEHAHVGSAHELTPQAGADETSVGVLARAAEHAPGDLASVACTYELVNVFRSRTGNCVTVAHGQALPDGPRGWGWVLIRDDVGLVDSSTVR